MEIYIGSGNPIQSPPSEVYIALSIWEAETLSQLLGKLTAESIRDIIKTDDLDAMPDQIFKMLTEIYFAFSMDDRLNVG